MRQKSSSTQPGGGGGKRRKASSRGFSGTVGLRGAGAEAARVRLDGDDLASGADGGAVATSGKGGRALGFDSAHANRSCMSLLHLRQVLQTQLFLA